MPRIRLFGVAHALALLMLATFAVTVQAQVTPDACTSSWSRVNSPNPGTYSDNILNNVSARTATDAMAVGYMATGRETTAALALHWNGSAWSATQPPSPGDNNVLWSFSAAAAGNGFAVGNTTTGSGASLVGSTLCSTGTTAAGAACRPRTRAMAALSRTSRC